MPPFWPMGSMAKHAQDKASRAQLMSALVLTEQQSGTHLQTAEFAGAFGAALKELWTTEHQPAERSSLILNALFRARPWPRASAMTPTSRSILTSTPTHLQNLVVRKLPTFVARIAELQEFFATSVTAGEAAAVRDVRLSALVGLVRLDGQ